MPDQNEPMRAEAVEADTLIQAGASAPTSPGRALAESRPSHRVRNALVGVGAGLGLAAGGFFGLRAVTAPDRSPTPSPSSSPVPTGVSSANPIIVPSTSPSTAPKTPEVTPTLSPEAQLKQEIADYSSGKIKLPETDGRFYLYLIPGEKPVLANVLAFNGVVNTDYAQPVVEVEFEGYIIDTKIIKASDNKNYLIAETVQESVKGSDGKSEQYILPINLGSVDSTSKDINILITGKGIAANAALSSQKLINISPADMEAQVENHKNEFVIFTLDIIKDGSQGYEKFRDPNYIQTQNAIAEDIIEFSKQTLKNPFSKVSQNNLIQGIINKPVEDGFDPSTIPMSIGVMFQ